MAASAFEVPKVGSTITLTTRYKSLYYNSTSEWDETTYEDVEVLPPESWLTSSQFMITSNTRRMPFRVIEIGNVVALSGGSRAKGIDSGVQTVSIKGSKGNEYHVTVENGRALSCTCPGYQFRKSCRHLKEAEQLTQKGN